MNVRDQELIVDLIDGRLDSREEQAAFARLERDAEFRAAYESQSAIAALLVDAPAATMTTTERSTLHAALKRDLHLEPAAPTAATPPSRRRRWLAPIGSLAAAAAVFAGLVVMLPRGADDAADVAMDVTTTSPAAETFESRSTDPTAGELSTTTGVQEGVAPAGAPDESAAGESSGEDVEESGAGVAEVQGFEIPHVPVVDLDLLTGSLDDVRQSMLEQASDAGASADTADGRLDACLATLGGSPGILSVEALATTAHDGADAVVVAITPSEGTPSIGLYTLDTCTEVGRTQG
jgi:hypothetical protein